MLFFASVKIYFSVHRVEIVWHFAFCENKIKKKYLISEDWSDAFVCRLSPFFFLSLWHWQTVKPLHLGDKEFTLSRRKIFTMSYSRLAENDECFSSKDDTRNVGVTFSSISISITLFPRKRRWIKRNILIAIKIWFKSSRLAITILIAERSLTS